LSKYDRYVLSQYLLFFGFFALVLVAVLWINRAVILFDRLIGDGQSAMVFLEFSALALPNLIRIILPMATFAAAVYVTNRLSSESELTVMRATGSSPWRMARPALWFGLITATMMAVLTNFLMPASIGQLALRQTEVSRNVTARLLSAGTFLHPAPGVTFYIRQIDADGALNDVFLSDRRDPLQEVTYTAARAFLVRDGEASSLIMVDGLAQQLDAQRRTLSTTNFDDFTYDISSLIKKAKSGRRNIRAAPTAELLFAPRELTGEGGYTPGQVAYELHLRLSRPLTALAVALIGFSTLMLGGYSRFGNWAQIALAFVLLVVLEVMRGLVSDPVLADPGRWPLIYLPAISGLIVAAAFLHWAAHPPRRLLRRRPDAAGATP
jgi:lipopolysaccharide export system permease protein